MIVFFFIFLLLFWRDLNALLIIGIILVFFILVDLDGVVVFLRVGDFKCDIVFFVLVDLDGVGFLIVGDFKCNMVFFVLVDLDRVVFLRVGDFKCDKVEFLDVVLVLCVLVIRGDFVVECLVLFKMLLIFWFFIFLESLLVVFNYVWLLDNVDLVFFSLL